MMIRFTAILTAICVLTASALAQETANQAALAKMPVKEVTVFKDGHALVLHSGKMATDGDGNVTMDYLPAPVLGTFWPYVQQDGATLDSVLAGRRKVSVSRTALSLAEIIEANIGAEVVVTEAASDKDQGDKSYDATIVSIPTRSSKELEETSPAGSGEMLPQKGSIVLLKTTQGTKAVALGQIKDITIKGEPRLKVRQDEYRNLLTLRIGWKGNQPQANVGAGLMYLQKGLRWIPSYKVTLDGQGKAKLQLQATLVNELTDLQDVTLHLVVGVPSFKFEGQMDPMALQEQMAQLSQHFQSSSRTAFALSNAIQSQHAFNQNVEASAPAANDGSQENAQQREDLYVYDIQHVTLKKGQRLVVPISETAVSYKDVYTLDVPPAPPLDAATSFYERISGDPQVVAMMTAPKVMHKIRLSNSGKAPFTTAPALILQDGQLLGQGLMQYTPAGSNVDLTVTNAVNVPCSKREKEVSRTPNAAQFDNYKFAKIELEGVLKLANKSDKAVRVEVVHYALGNITEASHDGKIDSVNVLEDRALLLSTGGRWDWRWYSWPGWWSHFNGVGKIAWTVTIEPGKTVELKYTWHYFWR